MTIKYSYGVLFFMVITLSACGKESTEGKLNNRWYTQSQVDAGKVVFEKSCSDCHGNDAQGTADWKQTLADGSYPPPPLNGTAHTWHHPLKALKRTISDGGIRLGGKMPAFKDKLSDEEQLAVIAYFQTRWSSKIYNAWLQRGGLK